MKGSKERERNKSRIKPHIKELDFDSMFSSAFFFPSKYFIV